MSARPEGGRGAPPTGVEAPSRAVRVSRGGRSPKAVGSPAHVAKRRLEAAGGSTVQELVTAPTRIETPATCKLAYTIAEVGELLGLCRATIYKLIGDGQLRTIYLSERAPRVLHEDVVAFLQRKRDEARERSEFIRSRLEARF